MAHELNLRSEEYHASNAELQNDLLVAQKEVEETRRMLGDGTIFSLHFFFDKYSNKIF